MFYIALILTYIFVTVSVEFDHVEYPKRRFNIALKYQNLYIRLLLKNWMDTPGIKETDLEFFFKFKSC